MYILNFKDNDESIELTYMQIDLDKDKVEELIAQEGTKIERDNLYYNELKHEMYLLDDKELYKAITTLHKEIEKYCYKLYNTDKPICLKIPRV